MPEFAEPTRIEGGGSQWDAALSGVPRGWSIEMAREREPDGTGHLRSAPSRLQSDKRQRLVRGTETGRPAVAGAGADSGSGLGRGRRGRPATSAGVGAGAPSTTSTRKSSKFASP